MSLFWFIILPLISALIGYISNSKWVKFTLMMMQLFFMTMAVLNFIEVKRFGTKYEVLGEYPLGVGIALRADIFGSVMVCLTVFLFSCLILYNYHKHYMNHLFMFLFLALQGLLCGLFLSNDLFNIYVLIEVSTILVSILIIFKKDSKSIYDGMLYFLTNLASMTIFFLGIGYMYKIFGTLDLTLLAERITLVPDKKVLIIPFVLLITAVDLKSAIMPLFSWLPKAHGTASAPSIISATLSGLYVKGGVYMFIRLITLFDPVFDSHEMFLFFGFSTAVIGFILALSQTDIKLILAYHTVSQIGLIVFGLSIGNEYSYWGAIYHICNHAIFKSTLFLTAGMIIEEYGTRNLTEVRGLFKRMPYVSIATILAILGITGAPLFNGSFSKYLIQKGTGGSIWFEICFFIINLGTILSFVKYSTMFFGHSTQRFKIRWNQKLVILTLGSICLLGGVFGSQLISILFDVHVTISAESYIEKFFVYSLSLGLGIGFYYFFYHKIKLFKKMREIELSFNQIILSIFIFYSGFLVYMMMRYMG